LPDGRGGGYADPALAGGGQGHTQVSPPGRVGAVELWRVGRRRLRLSRPTRPAGGSGRCDRRQTVRRRIAQPVRHRHDAVGPPATQSPGVLRHKGIPRARPRRLDRLDRPGGPSRSRSSGSSPARRRTLWRHRPGSSPT